MSKIEYNGVSPAPVELEASYEFTKAQIAELESLRAQLKEAQAEIEKLKAYYAQVFKDGERQIQIHKENAAASQANEVQLRKALYGLYLEFERTREWGCLPIAMLVAKASLSLPSDTTALDAMIQKAGEVMRERCAYSMEDYLDDPMLSGHGYANGAGMEIRALPGVTVEHLK